MAALLDLKERVETATRLGESHFREFKSAFAGRPGEKLPRNAREIRRDVGEALVAFANADGGELLIGVEDDGSITGVPHKDADVEGVLEAWRTQVHAETPLPPPRIARIKIEKKVVLYLSVEKSTRLVHLTSDGRCLQRRDRETVPVPTEQIQFERQEQISREYDRGFVDAASMADLDIDVVRRVGEEVAPGLSPEKILQLLDIADFAGADVRLRRAALLLMAADVARWHPRSEVRIVRVDGIEMKSGREYNVSKDQVVRGSILELLTKAWDEIRPYLVQTRLGPEGVFEEQIRYPEDACREALTNAIAHRDYSAEGRGIEVMVFDDRMEVRSPGSLLSTVTIEGLRKQEGLHQSRNTLVARSLRELGYMREMGEGLRRIYQLMSAHDLVDPELKADLESFSITLHHRSVFSEEAQRWIASYEEFALTREEEKVVLLGKDGTLVSAQQIWDALDLVDTEDYRAIIEGLQIKGLISGLAKNRLRGVPGTSRKLIPRWRIIDPTTANANLDELIDALAAIRPVDGIRTSDFQSAAKKLRSGNPYRDERTMRLLTRIGLIDDHARPIGRLSRAIGTIPIAVDTTDVLTSGSEIEDDVEVATTTKLYVGNLSFTATRDDVRRAFETIGPVGHVAVPRDVHSEARTRGFAFVQMERVADAKRAKDALDGHPVAGRAIRIDWARS